MAGILGSVTTSGVGSNRKSRDPVYRGGITRLDTGGAPSGVGAGSGMIDPRVVGQIQGPNIRSGPAARPQVQSTAKADVPLLSNEAVYVGMRDIAKASIAYADRVNLQHARAGVLEYREAMFQAFHNEEGGFRYTEGFAATEGFSDYAAKVDATMGAVLEKLSPAAKQKAMMDMYSVRESYLSKATTHVVEQNKIIDHNLRASEMQSLAKIMAATPQDILPQADGTPSIVKQEFFSKFKDRAAALRSWNGAVVTAGERMYLDGANVKQEDGFSVGLTQIKQYRNTIGLGELDTKSLNALDSYILQKENSEVVAYNAKARGDLALSKAALKTKQEKTAAVMLRKLTGDRSDWPTPAQAYDLVQVDALTLPQAIAFENHVLKRLKGDGTTLDREEYMAIVEDIDENKDVTVQLLQSNLPDTEFKSLTTLQRASKNKDFQADKSEAKMRIKGFITGEKTLMESALGTSGEAEGYLEAEAITKYAVLREKDYTHEEAMKRIETAYSNVKMSEKTLPAFVTGVKPKVVDDLMIIKEELIRLRNVGELTPEEEREQVELLQQWRSVLQSVTSNTGGGF